MKKFRTGGVYFVHHSTLLLRGDADCMIKVPSEYMSSGTDSSLLFESTKHQYFSVIEPWFKAPMSELILLTPEESMIYTWSGLSM